METKEENKEIHRGNLLKRIVKEQNPNRELLADSLGITYNYLYRLYSQKYIKDIYIVKACQYMGLDHKDYIDTNTTFDKVVSAAEQEKLNYEKLLAAKDETLEMYKLNKVLETENQQLREELATYKSGTQKPQTHQKQK